MNPLFLIGLAAIAFLGFNSKSSPSNNVSTLKQNLIEWINSTNDSAETKTRVINLITTSMTDQEIVDIYNYVLNYINKGIQILQTDPLAARINAIAQKYGIFG